MDLFKQAGEFVTEQLFAGNDIAVLTVGVQLKENQGILKTGSVLFKDLDGKFVLVSSATQKPEAILTDDIDTSESQIATAYITGQFNKKALKFGGTVTYEDFGLHLKALSIYALDIKED